jgi:hypothetical protein
LRCLGIASGDREHCSPSMWNSFGTRRLMRHISFLLPQTLWEDTQGSRLCMWRSTRMFHLTIRISSRLESALGVDTESCFPRKMRARCIPALRDTLSCCSETLSLDMSSCLPCMSHSADISPLTLHTPLYLEETLSEDREQYSPSTWNLSDTHRLTRHISCLLLQTHWEDTEGSPLCMWRSIRMSRSMDRIAFRSGNV